MAELLAPAGNFESLRAAIKAGANAIYFGIEHLNMRATSANNFETNDLKKIKEICQENNVRCYLTLNTLIYDHEKNITNQILKKIKEENIDAVIASDHAIIQKCNELNIEVHISTQMSISNYESIKFYSKFADRMVLARELTLPQIKEIVKLVKKDNLRGPNGRLIEIEAFIHGAMCIAVSGRCFMSLFEFNASANRGNCYQSCRRSYKVIDKETGDEMAIENEFVMSPEDMCTIEILDKLVDAGIHTLKIEGRARSVDYVFETVNAYKTALQAIEDNSFNNNLKQKLYEDLKKVFNRGFSKGFYMGIPLGSWSKVYGSKATEKKILVGKVINFFKRHNVAEIILESHHVSVGDTIGFSGETTGYFKQKLTDLKLDNKDIQKALKGQTLTIKVDELVRKNDKVYLFEPIKEEEKPKLLN